MTKAELIKLLKEKETTISSMQTELDSLRNDRVALDTIVTDQDTSILIASLNKRVKKLEERLKESK
jgi:hypothetical protein